MGEHLCAGRPAGQIIALAEELDADLVVVGSRRAGRVKRALLGSVSIETLRAANGPVLIVPSETTSPRRSRDGARS